MDTAHPDDPLARITPPVAVDDRLTVRHRLADGSATDLVGWVTAVDDGSITLLRSIDPAGGEDGGTVDRDRIILAKRVPAAAGSRPLSRVSAEELERVSLPGWIADSEPLGNWTLRSGRGFTGRANSCLAVGDPGMSYLQASESMIDFYRQHDLPPLAQVILDSEAEKALRDLGWQDNKVPTHVMTQPLTGLLGDHRPNPEIMINSELTESWWRAYRQSRAVTDDEIAYRILTGVAPTGLASAEDAGRAIAIGRGQVTGEWLGLMAVWTDWDSRRRGWASKITRELGHWAARRGARAAYLQVERPNSEAIDLYTRLGFTIHHTYRYLTFT